MNFLYHAFSQCVNNKINATKVIGRFDYIVYPQCLVRNTDRIRLKNITGLFWSNDCPQYSWNYMSSLFVYGDISLL